MSPAAVMLLSALAAPSADAGMAGHILHAAEGRVKTPLYAAFVLLISPEGKVVSCSQGESNADARSLAKLCPIELTLQYKHTAQIDGVPAWGRDRTFITIFDLPEDRLVVRLHRHRSAASISAWRG